MSILSRDKRAGRICLDGVLIATAMMLSYLEVLLPLNLIVPLPGFRLGLANVVILFIFCLISPIDAAIVSSIRVLLMGLLFGSATTLYFSIMGAILSFFMLIICKYTLRRCSFIGISILSASAHNCGQLIAASTLFGTNVAFFYLPWLLLASVIFGVIIGILLNLLIPRMMRFL